MAILPESRLNETLIHAFYDARALGDLAVVREMLDEDVIWREPDVGSKHTGDLRGSDFIIGMIQEASRLINGIFALRVTKAVGHGEQVAAFVDWSSTRDGKMLEGKEIAVYRIRESKIIEAYFHQDNLSHDEEFWS